MAGWSSVHSMTIYMIHAGYKSDQMYTREPGMSGGRLRLNNPDYSVICV